MKPPGIEIAVEAGEWPAKRVLRRLAERAVGAAVAELGAYTGASSHPSPSRFAATPSQQGGGVRVALELSIVFTNDAAMQGLNATWRGKDKPTNVLSFPQGGRQGRYSSPHRATPERSRSGFAEARGGGGPLLGDIVLAAETVSREAGLAELPLEDHIAHLIIHGFLHLLGYDHEAEADAEEMEQLERAALSRIGVPDPYAAAQRP
jgi:probable rRNA maturation factor